MEWEECLPEVQKKFDFYEIEWQIEKFYLASLSNNWKFQSPEINVRGYHSTKWFIVLECESDESESITLTLKRSDSDEGPEIMWVHWRITTFSADWKPDSSDRFCAFKKGFEYTEEFRSDKSVLELFRPFQPDCLTVRSKLILYSENSSLGFQLSENPGLRGLSEDLLRLFHDEKDPDLEVKVDDDIILAHKIIVYLRLLIGKSEYLLQESRNPIDGTSAERALLDLSHLKYDGMMKVMEFAYSGELKHVLSEPSLAIYDCVRALDISGLDSYYTPYELFLSTPVNSYDLVFTWFILDIRTLMSNKPVISPVFTDDCFGSKWQLHMSSEMDECESDYFDIYVKVWGDIKQLCANLQLAILDKNDRYSFPKRARCSINGMQTFEFKEFVRKDAAIFRENHYTLRVIASIQLSRRLTNSYTGKQIIPITMCSPEELFYNTLTANMEYAYETGDFSDFHLNINGIIYKIHKCVIAARSKDIYDLMRQAVLEGDKNKLSEIEPSTFRLLLRFLYTGLITEFDCEVDYISLYKVAVDFNLPILKEACSIFVHESVQNNSILNTKVPVQEVHDIIKESLKFVSELLK